MAQEDVSEYPKDDIDPRLKTGDWILKNAKYRWDHSKRYCPSSSMYFGRQRYQELRDFMAGRQSVENCKKRVLAEDQTDNSWMNIDWSVRPMMTTYVEKAISKILQRDFDIICTAINAQAKTDQDAFYNKLRIKLLMREAAQKQNPELLNNHALKMQPGEPSTLEQLDMYMQYGYKHSMSMFSEMSINLAFKENDIHKERKKAVTSSVCIGLSAYKDYISSSGRARFREVPPEELVSSYCIEPDFSDATHIGHVRYKTFGEIAKYYSKENLESIKKIAAGQYGNPSFNDTRWTKEASQFKVAVWDLEFFSYNDSVYEDSPDKRNNPKLSKISYDADPEKRRLNAEKKGETIPQFYRDTEEVIYKTEWIIGSDFHHNYGLATNQKSSVSDPRRTFLSFHVEAWNFDKMNFSGLVERLIPLQEEYQVATYKLQNFKNKWIPYILKIDIGALEKTGMKGKSGVNMTPLELLDFMFQQHILLLRLESGGDSMNPNYKPIELVRTQMAEDFRVIYEDMMRIVGDMEKIAGFNTVSAGGNVDPRMLQDGYAASLAGTTDSLFLIMESDKRLIERLSMGILQRQQIAVKLGKVDGYINSIGSAGVRFITIDPDISLYDYGLFAEDKPTAAKREQFFAKLEISQKEGLVLPQDFIMIESCSNLKQAEIVMAFRIDERQKQAQANAMQTQGLAQQGTMMNQQMAAKADQEKMDKQLEHSLALINAEKQWEYIIKQVGVAGAKEEAQIHAQSKIIAQQIIEDSKHKLAAKM